MNIKQQGSKENLYFIAILPPAELRNEIRAVKERMKAIYHASHALKSPAHITLQMPFKRSSQEEESITEALSNFAMLEKSFMINLEGFGAFAPRVIFIRITEPSPLKEIHSRLKKILLQELHFSQDEIMKDVQPHITVATRDLTKDAFNEAWPVLKDEEFRASFRAEGISLLKHNGRNWDVKEEFSFEDVHSRRRRL